MANNGLAASAGNGIVYPRHCRISRWPADRRDRKYRRVKHLLQSYAGFQCVPRRGVNCALVPMGDGNPEFHDPARFFVYGAGLVILVSKGGECFPNGRIPVFEVDYGFRQWLLHGVPPASQSSRLRQYNARSLLQSKPTLCHYDRCMPQQIEFSPIGMVHSPVVEPVNDIWGGVKCRIDLDPSRFTPDCLLGLADFSHVEVVFFFHRVMAEMGKRARTRGSRTDRKPPEQRELLL